MTDDHEHSYLEEGGTVCLADFSEAVRAELYSSMWGPIPDLEFHSNGCTHCPETWGGVRISPACHWHDWHYTKGGGALDRYRSDVALYWNLKSCGVSSRIAGIIYRRARLWGSSHFLWTVKPSLGRRSLSFFGNLFHRYLDVPLCHEQSLGVWEETDP